MKEESTILNKFGKEPGFKVPAGYFEDFNKKMLDQLPEVEITEVDTKPSLWLRVRPYVYMAAMFAGVWCMMHVFNVANGTAGGAQRLGDIAAGITVDNNADEFIMSGGATDYDILTYEDSVAMDSELPE